MTRPLVHLIARNDLDHTITLAINGTRHEFWLTPSQCDTVEFLCRNVSALKALNFAKRYNQPAVGSSLGTART